MARILAYPGEVFDILAGRRYGAAVVDTPRRYVVKVETIVYSVAGVSCEHCRAAITREVGALRGVESVDVDLDRKLVTIAGAGLSDVDLRAAIDEAGYEAVRAA
jgi:copper chaperone